ncbi:MAG: nicotinate-nucleotide adenylyltransferase [Bacillota bacterium]
MPYIGVLGGTFDPIHLGHLALAEGAMHLAGLDQVLFLPNRQPPHKAGRPVSDAAHRAAMVQLAIASNPRFAYSDLELSREGPSYTIDTVRALQALHPDWRLAFLVGMDSLLEITTWREYTTLLSLVDLLVVNRPGFPTAEGEAMLAALGPELSRRIRLLQIPGVAVAARDLRRLAAEGYPLRYLVPEPVERYIAAHRLYTGN